MEFRLKTNRERVIDKTLARFHRNKHKGMTVEQAADDIKDLVRFTAIVDEKSYARVTAGMADDLGMVRRKNYWADTDETGYRGFQGAATRGIPAGSTVKEYEFQIHTRRSFDAKMNRRLDYEWRGGRYMAEARFYAMTHMDGDTPENPSGLARVTGEGIHTVADYFDFERKVWLTNDRLHAEIFDPLVKDAYLVPIDRKTAMIVLGDDADKIDAPAIGKSKY